MDNTENLNTLKELIMDERKIVTYISISKEMCLHVNQSKSLLSQIVQHLRSSGSADIQLNVNYVVSGLLEDNKAQTSVCNESELASLVNKFKIVFYQHLYSVSLGPQSTDNVSFMANNKFEDFPLCTGLIKSNLCMKRSSDEIGNLKMNSQEIGNVKNNSMATNQSKVKSNLITKGNNLGESKSVIKNHEIKPETMIKTEIPSPKKEVQNSLSKNDNKSSKTQKGIAGFFNKPSATSSKQSTNVSKQNAPKKNDKQVKLEIKDEKMKTEEMDVDEEIPKKETINKNTNIAKKNGNHSLTQIKKNAKVDKKRKRVLHVSDTESEDEKQDPFGDEPIIDQESEDEIPPTPLVHTVKITSGITNPKKRRKIVDKTYTDEDGYILTKKEEVYESCSENEEEVHVKENIQQVNKIKVEVSPPEKKSAKNTKKKLASPQKGKQATLMSFFKKV